MSSSNRLFQIERHTAVGLVLLSLGLLWGCQALMAPITAGSTVPAGHVRATIQVQLPQAKGLDGFKTQATNDLRNLTLPAKMKLTVTGLDVDEPIEPSGDYHNPIPLATTQASVSMIVPLGRNLIIKAEGLTAAGDPIPSSVVKGVFSATQDGGAVTASCNRLTTPVAEVMEAILAKQSLGPDEQRRSRNLLLSLDSSPLQQFVQQTLLNGTGNMQTDLTRLANGQMLKHPGMVNAGALAKYVWERADVPPSATYLTDDAGGSAFLSAGKVTGVITGVRPGIPVTVLVDDPVSKAVTVEGSGNFTVTGVRPGTWAVRAVASGYQPTVTHYAGAGNAPPFYGAVAIAAGGEKVDQDFTLAPKPAAVSAVTPGRGPISPSVTNPAYVTLDGQDFGDLQDGSVIVFHNLDTNANTSANQIESWSNTRLRVAVPNLTTGNYEVRVDRPTINPAEFVSGTSQATYGAGGWQLLYPALDLPAGMTGAWQLGVASNNDLHVKGQVILTWDGMLRAYGPTSIALGDGANPPNQVVSDQPTATTGTVSWAAHPDGRSLYVWSTGTSLQARAFGTSGTPLGAAYTLVPTTESSQVDIGAEAAAFDGDGVLHLTYMAKSPDDLRPVYRRFTVNGLGVATPTTTPLRVDNALAGTPTQEPPRLRLGRGGHVLLTWVDHRSPTTKHYLRVIKPDLTFGTNEIVRTAPIRDAVVSRQGEIAVCTLADSEQMLARYSADGTLAGETNHGSWNSGGYSGTDAGLHRLVYDYDDHLIGVYTSLYSYNAGTYYGNEWRLFVQGFVPGTGGFVADSWRPEINVALAGGATYSTPVDRFAHVSPLVVGPDGTLSFYYKNMYSSVVQFMQCGWF